MFASLTEKSFQKLIPKRQIKKSRIKFRKKYISSSDGDFDN